MENPWKTYRFTGVQGASQRLVLALARCLAQSPTRKKTGEKNGEDTNINDVLI